MLCEILKKKRVRKKFKKISITQKLKYISLSYKSIQASGYKIHYKFK